MTSNSIGFAFEEEDDLEYCDSTHGTSEVTTHPSKKTSASTKETRTDTANAEAKKPWRL